MSVGARGLLPWLIQRFTAVYMAVFIIAAMVWLLVGGAQNYAEWRELFSCLVVNLATGVFFVCLLFHAWVGIRDIVMDYVTSTALRVGLLAGLGFMLLACGLWSARVLMLAAV